MNLAHLETNIAHQQTQAPFSGVIRLSQQGQTLLNQSYGLAQRAEGLPITPDTRFGMASGAKTFTSVAIAQLVERGLLAYDGRLADYVGVLGPAFDPSVTLHQLLTHSSGLPDYFDEEVEDDYAAFWRERPMYTVRAPRDFLPFFQDRPMKFAPGARWAYNNGGYILLGLVVEQVTGLAFPRYVEANVLAPCGMADSGYFALDQLPARTAYGYIEEPNGGWHTNIYALPIVGGPDGGAFTTAPDLARFWEALLAHRLLSETATKRLFTPHLAREAGSTEKFYGYGLWIRHTDADDEWYMLGEDPGVMFYSGYFPRWEAQLTVMSNSVDAAWPMAQVVRDALHAG